MISIDNAVELMIKTYLGLPSRVSGLKITRKEYAEMSESFPSLLDGLERHAAAELEGIDLGAIEWYHRLRNELYHQGNGLTVERDKVEVYAELANLLFRNLFGTPLVEHISSGADLLGEFFQAWIALEKGMGEVADRHSLIGRRPGSMIDTLRFVAGVGILTSTEVAELDAVRRLRNELAHGRFDHRKALTPAIVARVKELAAKFAEDE